MFRVLEKAETVHRNSNLTRVSYHYWIWNGNEDIHAERSTFRGGHGEHNRAWNHSFPRGLKNEAVQQLPGNGKLDFL